VSLSLGIPRDGGSASCSRPSSSGTNSDSRREIKKSAPPFRLSVKRKSGEGGRENGHGYPSDERTFSKTEEREMIYDPPKPSRNNF